MKNRLAPFAEQGYSARSIVERPAFVPSLDTRLIAAIQSRAGAQCHAAANLLHNYYVCAEACRCKSTDEGGEAVRANRVRFLESECRLREFLSTPGCRGWSPPPGMSEVRYRLSVCWTAGCVRRSELKLGHLFGPHHPAAPAV